MGLVRNLETWEIVEQVAEVRRRLPARGRVHGVVFQGMGEALANFDRVCEAISVLSEPSALAIDARNITVSTAGLPTGIRRLAEEAPNVRLALSLGSARPEVRRNLMPIEGTYPLSEVMVAAVFHAKKTRLSPLWAITLLSSMNDAEDDARSFAALARTFAEASGLRPRLSIIPYNPIGADDPFRRVAVDVESRFRDVLREEGFATHKRYSGGADVFAACGQLATGAKGEENGRA